MSTEDIDKLDIVTGKSIPLPTGEALRRTALGEFWDGFFRPQIMARMRDRPRTDILNIESIDVPLWLYMAWAQFTGGPVLVWGYPLKGDPQLEDIVIHFKEQ